MSCKRIPKGAMKGSRSRFLDIIESPRTGEELGDIVFGDLTTRDGFTHLAGWYSVRLNAHARKVSGLRSCTFYGETAWSDAERYAADVRWAFERSIM